MTDTNASPIYWSAPQKIAFRFILQLFTLYIIFNPNGVLPYTEVIAEYYIKPFHTLIPWLAQHVLHLGQPITVFTNGSGDTTYDYLIILFIATVAAIGTLIWSIADRRSRNYNKLFYWLCVIVRYYVGITMLSYGFVKVIKLQFPSPSPGRLVQSIGNASPMGLAWTYMGYSRGFNYFTGIAEVSCGLLLFFRKTTTLGAVLGLVVAGNIMAINYCFDVPVKLLSTTLVLMSLFLLSKDASRLINFFFLNKTAPPSEIEPHRFRLKWKNVTLSVFKYILLVYLLVSNINDDIKAATQYGDAAVKPHLYGIYDIQTYVLNKDTVAPLTTNINRWRKLMVGASGRAMVKKMNDSTENYTFRSDIKAHTIVMFTDADTVNKYYFNYAESGKTNLILTGKYGIDSLHISLEKFDLNKFRLNNRGFHWINEYPYNK
ncbi:hypothetical protein [Mucilaginibacter kameinonensis]|uniref:hypothetical protein n=1 Tax=Mucilaginibacter kameinonensis TaxID=452286 RepID=UPI000EF7FC33|nr:hypothetical protein [Mucilaginibacter kameinonensis]